MGILKVNDMIPDFANFCTFKGSSRGTAFSKVPPTVGRGPVPRHAAILTENVRSLLGVERFLSRPEDRGGQAPALRKKDVFSVPFGSSRGTGPRAPACHRRARACPSPMPRF